MQDADDTALVRQARAGDQEALDQLIRRHQGRVRAYLGVRLYDASLVDDLAQDALVIACDRLETFDEREPFFPWLRGIAHNVLRQHLRKRRPEVADPHSLAALLDEAALEQADADGDGDDRHAPALRACLARLSGTAARTIQAHYFEDQALADIALQQGRTAKAVGVMLVRTRQWLRACVQSRLLGGAEQAGA